jgi:hypothetical protein
MPSPHAVVDAQPHCFACRGRCPARVPWSVPSPIHLHDQAAHDAQPHPPPRPGRTRCPAPPISTTRPHTVPSPTHLHDQAALNAQPYPSPRPGRTRCPAPPISISRPHTLPSTLRGRLCSRSCRRRRPVACVVGNAADVAQHPQRQSTAIRMATQSRPIRRRKCQLQLSV